MSKFKVGDRVRLLGEGNHLVTDVAFNDDLGYEYVYLDGANRDSWAGWDDASLELIAPSTDNINPAHYGAGGEIECIDAIRAQMNADAFKGYLRGNIVKYCWRYEQKGGAESLEKAKWYLDRLISEVRDNG